jgi:hypothetical protein
MRPYSIDGSRAASSLGIAVSEVAAVYSYESTVVAAFIASKSQADVPISNAFAWSEMQTKRSA